MFRTFGRHVARFAAAALLVAAAGTAWSVQEAQLRVEATNHTAAVRRIAVSPNEALIATVGDDKTGRIWQASDRRLLATLRVPVGAGDAGRLYGVAFSPDGKEIAVGGTSGEPGAGHRIDVFNAANGVHQRTLALDAGNIVRLLWTRDGRHVVACLSGGNGVRIFSPAGRNTFADTFGAPCFGLAELPDGSILASGFDGEIRHYRLQGDSWAVARRIRTEISDPQAIAVSPDGLHFAVGYRSRLSDGSVAVDVFDTEGGVLAKRFTFSDLRYGSLGSVAWSRDGRVIAASGRASDAGGYRLRIIMKRIAWPQGAVSSDFVATDTIQDTAPIGQDRFAVASSNGSWTVVPASGPLSPLGASVIDLRGPDNLKVAADARRVSFGSTAWSGPRRFNLPERDLQLGEDNDLESARRSSFFRRIERWENEYRPIVGGQAVKMGPLELSRSAAMLPDDAGVVLGTSRTLRRLGWDGAQIWSVRVATEVTSVNTSRDGKIVVSTQMDGTVRWWRAADGLPLLTLFTSIDDKWVLWTEDGYYDAAPGAESLIGWQVNREGGTGVDYFSIGRFREKYNRPDVIDRVLDTLDPQRALALADEARHARAAADTQESPAPKAEAKPAPQADPHAGLLPPVLTVLANRSLQSETTVMRIDFSVRAESAPANAMIVRVDGRPVEPTTSVMPERQDGEAMGHLLVPMPARNAELAVMAQAGALLSEPVHLAWVWRPTTRPADPVTPLASIPPASGIVASGDPPSSATRPPAPATASSTSTESAPKAAAPPVQEPTAPAASQPSQSASAQRPSEPAVSVVALPGIIIPAPPPTPLQEPPPTARPAAGSGERKARLFLLAIGVSKYSRKEYALGLPAKDAGDFAGLMSGQGGRMYASVDARLLTDEKATRAAVLDALAWMRNSVGPNDTGMLFIAGHGVNDSDGRYYFLPHDAEVERLASTAIGESELRRTLAALSGKAMLFVDTCHAGNVIGTGAAVNNEIARLANTLAAAENGVIVFSASTGRQDSIEDMRWGNGAFTKALIEGLKGAADFRQDGVVTHQGLSYFLGRAVKTLTKGRQTPVTAVPLGMIDFPLVQL